MEIMIEHCEQSVQKYLCPKCKYPYTITEFFDVMDMYKEAKCDGCGYIYTDAEEYCFNRVIYEKECICGQKLFLLTQSDDGSPEYHTNVGMQCPTCEEINWFSLPVN